MAPQFYTSESHFLVDQEKIFRTLWIFAGLKVAVSRNQNFLTREIGGVPILIQNVGGELRAFVNSCAHRGSKLQTEEFGSRPLACKYHGWKYDGSGDVTLIPYEDKCYKFDPSSRSELKLQKVHLSEVGQFLFVNLSENPMPIEMQFSTGVLGDLKSISQSLDNEFAVSKVKNAYNWKLPFENLRDGLHPIFVHPRTLSKDVDFSPSIAAIETTDLKKVSLKDLSYGGPEGNFKKDIQRPLNGFVERWGKTDAYFNWLLYPNTHIASADGGYTFTIEQYHPVSASETVLINTWIAAKKVKPYATARVLWEHTIKARSILDEDADIMELAQQGLNLRSPQIRLGQYERENKKMEAWYLSHIRGESNV